MYCMSRSMPLRSPAGRRTDWSKPKPECSQDQDHGRYEARFSCGHSDGKMAVVLVEGLNLTSALGEEAEDGEICHFPLNDDFDRYGNNSDGALGVEDVDGMVDSADDAIESGDANELAGLSFLAKISFDEEFIDTDATVQFTATGVKLYRKAGASYEKIELDTDHNISEEFAGDGVLFALEGIAEGAGSLTATLTTRDGHTTTDAISYKVCRLNLLPLSITPAGGDQYELFDSSLIVMHNDDYDFDQDGMETYDLNNAGGGIDDDLFFLEGKTDRQMIDFYHARGYVGKAVAAIHWNNRHRLAEVGEEWSHDLKHKKGAAKRISDAVLAAPRRRPPDRKRSDGGGLQDSDQGTALPIGHALERRRGRRPHLDPCTQTDLTTVAGILGQIRPVWRMPKLGYSILREHPKIVCLFRVVSGERIRLTRRLAHGMFRAVGESELRPIGGAQAALYWTSPRPPIWLFPLFHSGITQPTPRHRPSSVRRSGPRLRCPQDGCRDCKACRSPDALLP
jgi:hypothetical protein